ncbi:MAG: hypothetical protein WBJ05_01155, partial [Bacillota bacterium]
ELMQTLETGSLVKNIMITEPPSKDPAVTIGEENRIETVKEFSFVYGTFRVGSSEGKIGIFGPKRMNYPRAVAVVSFFERNLNEILDVTD